MTTIKAGVHRALISPEKGMYLIGYGDRAGGAEYVHDELTATTLVLDDGGEKAVIVSLDLLFLHREIATRIRAGIADEQGIPEQNILLCCSHTHSGPVAWAPRRFGVSERLREIKNRILALPAVIDRLKAYLAEDARTSGKKNASSKWAGLTHKFLRTAALAPKALTQPKGTKANSDYLNRLVETIIESARAASGGMDECEMTHGRASAVVGINRRERKADGTIELGYHPDGPVDRDVDVVRILRANETLVTLVNHACHVTSLGPNSNRVSAGMIGVMREKVEKELGGLCMFIQGACGNINPNVEWSDNNMPDVKRFGGKLADAVLEAAKNTKLVSPTPLKGAEETLEARLDVEEEMADWPAAKIIRHVINRMLGVPKFLIYPLISIRFPWKADVRKDADGYTTPIHFGALRLGDVAIGWIAMEPFIETSLAVKAASPAPITLFAGYTNGYNGYLPTAEESALGGYEVEQAPYMLGLPGIFRADTEAKVAARLTSLLNDVAP